MLQMIIQIDLDFYIRYIFLRDDYKHKLLTMLHLLIFKKYKN